VVLVAEKFVISPKIKATNQTEPRSTKPFPSRGGVGEVVVILVGNNVSKLLT